MSQLIGNLKYAVWLWVVGWICLPVMVMAQFEENYEPIQLTGEVPPAIRTAVGAVSNEELASNAGRLGRRQAKEYYTLSNYALSEALRSGDIYFNDEVSLYLSTIVDTLLKDEPALRANITVYATRINIPNANCWRDGTIFFNLPLLTYMESEAQVAFILAHEIAHYRKKHVLKQYRKVQQVKEAFQRRQDSEQMFEVLRFSREQESEADVLGFDLIMRSPYNPAEALGALQTMSDIDAPSTGDILDLVDLFDVDSMSSLSDCACDSSDITKKSEVTYNVFSSGNGSEDEERERDDDELATHPSIESRIEKLAEKLVQAGPMSERSDYLLGEDRFKRIRDIAYFESIEKMFQRASYVVSLYSSLRLVRYFPDNQYLHEMAAKNLYWLAFYDAREQRRDLFLKDRRYESLSYGSFACTLRCLSSDDFQELADVVIADRIARFPQSESLMILKGQLAELRSQTEDARTAYEAYLDTHPEGSHRLFAQYRLQQL